MAFRNYTYEKSCSEGTAKTQKKLIIFSAFILDGLALQKKRGESYGKEKKLV